jgi:pyruvate formate lyase activating enzyme
MRCEVCFRHCLLQEGQVGFCKARGCLHGQSVPLNYGLVSSCGLDPIEKKPLKEFRPGSLILSVGSYGCNLRCPFCQNFEISQYDLAKQCERVSPSTLVEEALALRAQGNIGLAYTYNEPMVGYEYVRDCAKLAHEAGLVNVLVTNGCASQKVLAEVLPYLDAMNIDLKGFSPAYFSYVGGDFEMTKDFIVTSAHACHIELTTLIIPHHNDDPSAMEKEAQWIASIDPSIPLHLTRYFPRYKEKEAPTPLKSLEELSAIARRYLSSVYLGNI